MGLTKQYLRWEQGSQFGIIGSQAQAICILNQWPEMLATNRIVASAACENIVFWDLKTGQPIDRINGEDDEQKCGSPISCMSHSAASNVIATGHGDGSVRLFDCHDKHSKVVFSGHKGFVSCVAFDHSGLRVASAGKDTDIVVWDVANNSGLFRLKGHKGVVNKVQFMKHHQSILISASTDTFIKFWDLNTQHCFKTLVDHRSEVWSFVVYHNDSRLISGGSDSELRVWRLLFAEDDPENFEQKSQELKQKRIQQLELIGENPDEAEDLDSDSLFLVERFGTILRKSTERILNIFLDPSETLLLCHGKDQYFECFKIRDEDEVKIKIKKRLKKERKRRLNESAVGEYDGQDLDCSTLSDEIEKLDIVKASSRIKSIDARITKNTTEHKEFRVALLLSNNSIESYQLSQTGAGFEAEQTAKIVAFGHRSDVRTVSISSDSLTILTGSVDSVKLWNKSSCRCISTITDGLDYPLCSTFAPGDKHALLGSKSGKILILNLTTAQVQTTIEASEVNLPIWSICLQPDLTGVISGSEDKCVKFWSFDLAVDEQDGSRNLTLCHEKTLEAEEGVICAKMSPNSKFIAASLLDSTVKIYFADTLKFFLSLYGHKFPVLCMDISTDNSLIVTGSSDKNIKIWGMDFGDCHRSLFAHDDNIMCLAFIPKTHQFFTASKDNKIKLWDADSFEKITTLDAHHGEVWTMAVAPNGKYLVSASHDKSIRIWNKTNEPLILEEEKEAESERLFEKEIDDGSSQPVVAGEEADKQTSGLAEKKTSQTVKSVEKLMEGINVFNEEMEKIKLYQQQCLAFEKEKSLTPKPTREPVNANLTYYRTDCPHRYMLELLVRIKSNEVEETLLELPFGYTRQLLHILADLLDKQWEVETVCRCICFVIRINFGQITSTPSLVALVDRLRAQMHTRLSSLCDLFGVNSVGLQHYQAVFESRENISLFGQLLREQNSKRKKREKQRTAPILTWT